MRRGAPLHQCQRTITAHNCGPITFPLTWPSYLLPLHAPDTPHPTVVNAQLMPKPTDLSYYNWETQTSTSNSSPNFQVPRLARRDLS